MAYFLNPFAEEFRGTLPTSETGIVYIVKGNSGRLHNMVFSQANPSPATTFDLSGSDANGGDKSVLTIGISVGTRFNYITIDIAGATPGATKISEMVALLNADSMFSSHFTATAEFIRKTDQFPLSLSIKNNKDVRFYIKNTGAESVLKFNLKAGVADIPAYFERNSIGNESYTEGSNSLIVLTKFIVENTVASPSVVTSYNHGLSDGDIITIANSNSDPVINGDQTVTVIDADTFSVPVNVSSDPGTKGVWARAIDAIKIGDISETKEDYQLLRGKSGLFVFKKITVDGDDRPTQIIEYNAGSVAGSFARLIKYTYTSTNKNPDTITELPYILLESDLIVP